MPVPAPLVATARRLWHCQWQRLMDGLAAAGPEGDFQRRPTQFCDGIEAVDPQALAETRLVVGRSCPWAHRLWLLRSLRGLEPTLALTIAEPDPAGGRWLLPEPLQGCRTLAELYHRCGGDRRRRATVPLLVSGNGGGLRLIGNDSAALLPLLDRWPADRPPLEPPQRPAAERELSRLWAERLQDHVNDGVYRCGFARTQAAYTRAATALFTTLEALEQHLTDAGPWIAGDRPSLADVRLFPTLIRWEAVYAPLFGCSRRPLWSFPALWRWRARFHALPGVAGTCWPEAWRRDYFGALFPLHPSGLVPEGPDLARLVAAVPPAVATMSP